MDITQQCQQMQRSIEQGLADFDQHADVNRLLRYLYTLVVNFIEDIVAVQIQQHLYADTFLGNLKAVAAKSAPRFKGWKATSVRLLSGRRLSIRSPFFCKAAPQNRRGPKTKKRTAKSGCHIGLSQMGFVDRCSPYLASAAMQAALLCPSFEIAQRNLLTVGITMDVKTIQRLCQNIGGQAIQQRNRIALSHSDTAKNRILLVCIDGGRLRERKAKRGRRPAHLKRQGYHTDWREPTQLVIEWINADGTKCNKSLPIYDATMADTDQAFQLLEGYLRQLDCTQADMVVFCADGARRYWKRFGELAKRLELEAHLEVIDYTHAKQNLNEILENLPKKLGTKKLSTIAQQCHNLLWQGGIEELGQQIQKG